MSVGSTGKLNHSGKFSLINEILIFFIPWSQLLKIDREILFIPSLTVITSALLGYDNTRSSKIITTCLIFIAYTSFGILSVIKKVVDLLFIWSSLTTCVILLHRNTFLASLFFNFIQFFLNINKNCYVIRCKLSCLKNFFL